MTIYQPHPDDGLLPVEVPNVVPPKPRIKVQPSEVLTDFDKEAIAHQYLEVIKASATRFLAAMTESNPDPITPDPKDAVLLSPSGSSREQLPPTAVLGERSERAEPSSSQQ